MERTKNASRNIVYGFVLKIYQLALPFVMRTIMMYSIGVQYLGLNSLFTSIFQVLNLAELGVGSAMVFSMYKPIVEDDKKKICALMKLYRFYYRIIGSFILVVGLFLLPCIPKLINNEIPQGINVYILYLLNLFATVLTYWLFAYKNSIFQAYQRTDIVSKVTIGTDTCRYTLQIVALLVFKNYYFYLISILFTQIVNNLVTAYMSQKMYPQFHPNGGLEKDEIKEINGKIKDLCTSKLGYTIVSSADTIVISAFLGLTILAQYQNYYFILNAIIGFVAIIYTSITAGVGNSMLTKTVDQNYKEFEIFTLLITWVSGFCISCFRALYQSFMLIWMGEDMLLNDKMVILFCIYFWVYELVMMISVYKDAGGIWHEDRYRPLVSGIFNLVINLLLVQLIQLYGVVLSTIMSICLVSLPWIIRNVFALIFKRSPVKYILKLIKYSFFIMFVSSVTYISVSYISGSGLAVFLIKVIVTILISNCLLLILLMTDSNFQEAKELLFRLTHIEKILAKVKNRGKSNE